jgi:glycosyltransferase involved in cell wall biosynthesis
LLINTVGRHASVSVVIPTYNRAAILGRAIGSCQRQSYPVDEVIVVDDASSDSTQDVVARIAHCNPKVRYIRIPYNQGAQNARIQGVTESTGEWVVFLDADDELLPDSIRDRIHSVIASQINPGLVYGDIYQGAMTDGTLFRFKKLYGYEYPWLCKELSLCPYSAIMVRKDCFPMTGYPDLHFPSWQDDDMVLTIGKIFPILHCDRAVAIMHSSSDSITSNWSRVAKGCRLIVSKYKDDIVKYHGRFRLVLWYLRVVRAYLYSWYQRSQKRYQSIVRTRDLARLPLRILLPLYSGFLQFGVGLLTRYLKLHFEHMYS